MRKSEIDDLLSTMLESHDNVVGPERHGGSAAAGGGVRRAGVGAGRSADRQPDAVPDRDLRAEHHQRRSPPDRAPASQTGSCDTSYYLPGEARFRVNIFSQRGNISIVLRKLETQHPDHQTASSCRTPSRRCRPRRTALILITGATGSGQDDLAGRAAQRDQRHQVAAHRDAGGSGRVRAPQPQGHLQPARAGPTTTRSPTACGPRSARRPRSSWSVRCATAGRPSWRSRPRRPVTSCSPPCTPSNAGQAINRVVGMFDKDEEKQIRQRLADTLRWVVGQRLVPKVGGGRWAVHDILSNTIRSNEAHPPGRAGGQDLLRDQEVGEPFGMMTFDQSLLRSYEHGIVTEDTAVNYSTRKAVVQRGIDTVKQTREEKTTDVEGLKLDHDYNRSVFGREEEVSAETAAGADFETRLALVCEDAPSGRASSRRRWIRSASPCCPGAQLRRGHRAPATRRLRDRAGATSSTRAPRRWTTRCCSAIRTPADVTAALDVRGAAGPRVQDLRQHDGVRPQRERGGQPQRPAAPAGHPQEGHHRPRGVLSHLPPGPLGGRQALISACGRRTSTPPAPRRPWPRPSAGSGPCASG